MNIKTETHTYEISYSNLESALIHFLHSNRLVPLEWDVLELDTGFPVNDKGNVEFDITFAIPENKSSKRPYLKVVHNENQPTLFDL